MGGIAQLLENDESVRLCVCVGARASLSSAVMEWTRYNLRILALSH